MKWLIESYFLTFVHPFKIYDFYLHNIPLEGRELDPPHRLDLKESLTLAWFFMLIRAFIELIMMVVFFNLVTDYYWDKENIFKFLELELKFTGYYVLMIKLVLETLFFPLITILWSYFWIYFFKWLGDYLGVSESRLKAELVVQNALSVHFIRVVPVFGEVIYNLLLTLHFYAGLRKGFELSPKASIMALVLPYVVSLLLLIVMIISVALLMI